MDNTADLVSLLLAKRCKGFADHAATVYQQWQSQLTGYPDLTSKQLLLTLRMTRAPVKPHLADGNPLPRHLPKTFKISLRNLSRMAGMDAERSINAAMLSGKIGDCPPAAGVKSRHDPLPDSGFPRTRQV